MKKILITIGWLMCSIYSYGTMMADLDWKNEHSWKALNYNSRDNLGISAIVAASGPIGAPVAVLTTNFNQHGWEIWEKKEADDNQPKPGSLQ